MTTSCGDNPGEKLSSTWLPDTSKDKFKFCRSAFLRGEDEAKMRVCM
jgi:hypothetical protein